MFYKYEQDKFMEGPFVMFPDGFMLHPDYLDGVTLPYEGWYYFNTNEEARSFFNIASGE